LATQLATRKAYAFGVRWEHDLVLRRLFVPSLTDASPHYDRVWVHPSVEVLKICDRLKVLRIDAHGAPAEVVYDEPVRDRPDREFPTDCMGFACPAIKVKLSIPAA